MNDATKITNIGEFGLINRLTNNIKLKNESSVLGVGDDAAVLDFKNKQTVVTTDILMEGIHFNLMYSPLKHLGYKAVVSNLSDIYAMNAKPTQILVSLAFSKKLDLEMIDQLYDGMKMACEAYGVDIVGGDTASSLTGLTISITAIGEADKDELVYRKGAKVNDLICVSGNLGAAYMGLQLLEREKNIFEENPEVQPDLSGKDYILERQLKPEARKDIIDALKKLEIKPTSMIDISDGLSSELFHICDGSDTGCKIFTDKIPIDTETSLMAEELNMEPLITALHGGEDYELLFTVSIKDFDKIKQFDKVSVIGHITSKEEGKSLITPNGDQIELQAQGWDNLSDEEE